MRKKRLFWSLACVGLLGLPTTAMAAETVTVCVMNAEEAVTQSKLAIFENGAVIEVEATRIENGDNTGCWRLNLVSCDDTIVILAEGDWLYREAQTQCKTDPAPIVIAMEYNALDVVAASFNPETLVPEDFAADIGEAVAASGGVFATISPEAATDATQLFTALQVNDYASAQFYANEAAAHLRAAGRDDLAVAYSSLTYVTGLRAIGADPFNSDNPLVVASDDNVPAMVVLNDEGQNLLGAYLEAAEIVKPVGTLVPVYDFKAATGIRQKTTLPPNVVASDPIGLPAGGWRRVQVNDLGRIQLR